MKKYEARKLEVFGWETFAKIQVFKGDVVECPFCLNEIKINKTNVNAKKCKHFGNPQGQRKLFKDNGRTFCGFNYYPTA